MGDKPNARVLAGIIVVRPLGMMFGLPETLAFSRSQDTCHD
jgi:hypothetical protein